MTNLIQASKLLAVVIASLIFQEIPDCFAQSDSLNLVSAKWDEVKISKGVTWKSYQFKSNLFSSYQNINILEVKRRSKNDFSVGFEVKILKPTSDFGKSSTALAALNGTFFDIKEGGSVDLIKSQNQIINENRLNNGKRSVHQKAAIVIDDGKLSIAKWEGSENWEHSISAEDIMVSGPLLVYNATFESIDSSSFSITRHPRTVVGITKRKILMVTIDGRHENAAGMSLFELQKVMRWFQTDMALNLDGGGSTTLWIQSQPANGVVNYPCDNKTWDHTGERKVANVLVVKKR